MKKRNIWKSPLCICLGIFFAQSHVYADSAISVPRDARSVIEQALNDLAKAAQEKREILYKNQAADYVQSAHKYKEEAQSMLDKAVKRRQAAEAAYQDAAAKREQAEADLQDAQASYEESTEEVQAAYDAADQAYQEADALLQASYAEEAKIQQMVDEANRTGREIQGDPADYIVDWAKVPAARMRADELRSDADSMQQNLNASGAYLNFTTNAFWQINGEWNGAKQDVLYAKKAENDAIKNKEKAEENLDKALKNQKILLDKLAHPPAMRVYSRGADFYSWKDSAGNKGQELVLPFYYGYEAPKNQYSYGVYTSVAIADHSAGNVGGNMETFTDTTVHMTKRSQKEKFTTEYLMQINLPTGKNKLSTSGVNSRMSDDLVSVDSFGKSWQFQPGVQTSWKNGEFDKWTVGTSYLYSEAYDQTLDIANNILHPGYEWAKWLRYQHAEEKWQLVSEIQHTTYGKSIYERSSLSNGGAYELSAGWKYRLTYNRSLDEKRNLLLYYWRENGGNNDASTQPSNGTVNYYGAQWSRKLNAKRTLRFGFDIMSTNGNRYAGMEEGTTDYYYKEVNGRTKYTLDAGYDIRLNDADSFKIDLQLFKMQDGDFIKPPKNGSTGARDYTGCNLLFSYNKAW